jgi:hypothetical protein
MGVHSGRSGPKSKTLGCIRTDDESMEKLNELHKTDPLKFIQVGGPCPG